MIAQGSYDADDYKEHGEALALPILGLIRDLLLAPGKIIAQYKQGNIKDHDILQKDLIFLFLASLFFTVTTVIYSVPGTHPTQETLVIRFFVVIGSLLFVVIPIFTLFWSILQKVSCWFWNIKIPFLTLLGVSGLSIFYYAVIFFVGIPLFVLEPYSPFVVQGLLFGLNLIGFALLVRMFKNTYCILGGASTGKAFLIIFFPMALILLVYGLIQLLTFFAIYPHLKPPS